MEVARLQSQSRIIIEFFPSDWSPFQRLCDVPELIDMIASDLTALDVNDLYEYSECSKFSFEQETSKPT